MLGERLKRGRVGNLSTDAGEKVGTGARLPLVSVVIPALNEERNLPYVFERMPPGIAEVILVDGGSVDRTVEVAVALCPSIIVVQQTRKGKGNALACGFAACSGDIIVMIDADGSTDPAEIPSFVEALVQGADWAKGSRFRKGGDSHDITRIRKLGNYGLNGVVNILFGTRFTDLCYGYNAFWRSVLPILELPDTELPPLEDGGKLWGDGFEIETLINVRAAANGLVIKEVPSVEAPRLHGDSNLNAFSDGNRVLRTILTEYRRHRGRRSKDLPTTHSSRRSTLADVYPTIPLPRTRGDGVVAQYPVRPAAMAGAPTVVRQREGK